ncbi:Extracellular metalloprotease [Colletotrichum siamense]|uniref:Extracellular metalloprotease n=1 Tax=Colletotrichum siamense TaxID=690259 RepID=A0A9P5BRT7_COLSI|nr:Extracellular metalloprotease [Colletotrichum siamense]KAF4829544.1 Extracellular metalloprotease [Colletotrichum siamense]KAF4840540.1 Extracellular metalloprotease [Colletotrichum siamense]KAF5486863.1 Extracellular metalloprotease [Colletotrichum siamense]
MKPAIKVSSVLILIPVLSSQVLPNQVSGPPSKMQFKTLVLSALAVASGAFAQRSCGTPSPSEEQIEVAERLMLKEENARVAGNSTRLAPINVNVYWHVIARSQTVANGYLTQATLDEQLDVLNAAFAPHDVQFSQAGADWTINTQWASDSAELTMKRSLRKGTYADLNVYFVPGTPYLGYAYFPQTVSTGSSAFYYDGVVIRSAAVPGGSLAQYNLGHTATHEIGHWLGLYHTFEGYQCGGNGDYVSDTPFESEEAYNCEIGRDTCPTLAGTDPVTNYMDYSDDDCFTHFTDGQETRMHSYWDTYRASYQ